MMSTGNDFAGTSGTIPGRTLNFTKSSAATSLKVEYFDTFGVYGPGGAICNFEIKIDGASCSTPLISRAYAYVSSGFGGDMYPGAIAGYCNGISTGAHTVTVAVTSSGSPNSCYAGYATTFSITTEELGGTSAAAGTGTTDKVPLWGAGNRLLDSPIAASSGNVGIGTTSPAAKLEVAGQIVSQQNTVSSGATVDFSSGNTQALDAVGGATITLQNMVAGGSYTLVVRDTTSRIYVFNGCDAGFYRPPNAATTAGTRTIYQILAVQNGATKECYIAWSSDFN